jgi:hypothetical protein
MTVRSPPESDIEVPPAEAANLAGVVTDEAVVAEPPSRREKMAATTLCVLGFLTFYLLSAGPIAGLHKIAKIGAFQKAVEVIYAPVVLLVKGNIEPFSSIMKWYIGLFQ